MADPVARPAQQRAVVVFADRRVRHHTRRPHALDVLALHVQAVRRAVERPLEVDVPRVRVDLARDVRPLLLRHAVHPRLVRLTGGCVCAKRTGFIISS